MPRRGKRGSPGGCTSEMTLLTKASLTISQEIKTKLSCNPPRKSGPATFSTFSPSPCGGKAFLIPKPTRTKSASGHNCHWSRCPCYCTGRNNTQESNPAHGPARYHNCVPICSGTGSLTPAFCAAKAFGWGHGSPPQSVFFSQCSISSVVQLVS